MNHQSEQLVNELQNGSRTLFANVYTQFLQIPADVLTSNEKIIIINLFALFHMYNQNLDFSNSAISKLTGIPVGTVNRIMPLLPARVADANQWLTNNGFQERIELRKATKFGSASYYYISRITPPLKQSAGFNLESDKPEVLRTEAPAPAEYSLNENQKIAALALTNLDPDDTKRFLKYPIERIERNVRYFKEKYLEQGKQVNIQLFARTISHDWGREYLENTEKAAFHVETILQLAAAANSEIDKLNIKRDFFHRFAPISPQSFKDKSAVNLHFDIQFNKLGDLTKKAIEDITYKVYLHLKNHSAIAKRTDAVRRQLTKLAVMQCLNGIIQTYKKAA